MSKKFLYSILLMQFFSFSMLFSQSKLEKVTLMVDSLPPEVRQSLLNDMAKHHLSLVNLSEHYTEMDGILCCEINSPEGRLLANYLNKQVNNNTYSNNNNNAPNVNHTIQFCSDSYAGDDTFSKSRQRYREMQEMWEEMHGPPQVYELIPGSIVRYGSDRLKTYVFQTIVPMLFEATIGVHYYAIPGYHTPHGMRNYFIDPKQLSDAESNLIWHLNHRLESYFTRIEDIIFDWFGRFRESLSLKQQTQLAKIFADFLKEFYPEHARTIFEQEANNCPIIRSIIWSNGVTCENIYSSERRKAQIYANSLNGQLGIMYRALDAGDNERALAAGRHYVHTSVPGIFCGDWKDFTYVFEQYPKWRQIVEQRCYEDNVKAKIAQEKIAQELAKKKLSIQQQSVYLLNEYATYYDYPEWQPYQTILDKRIDAAKYDVARITLQKRIHHISPTVSPWISMSLLTADQKSILFDGGQLQHTLVDEAVDAIDTIFAQHCKEKLEEAAVDYAHQSLSSNQEGDVITASRMLDVCWMIYDFTKKFIQHQLDPHDLWPSRIEGVKESLHDNAQMLLHPIETVVGIVQGCATIVYYMSYVPGMLYEYVKDFTDTDFEKANRMLEAKSSEPPTSVLSTLWNHAKNISKKDIARIEARLATDYVIMLGVGRIVSLLIKAKAIGPFMISCMRKGNNIVNKGSQTAKAAATAGSATIECAEEIAALVNDVQKMSDAAKASAIVNEGFQVAKAAATAESIIAAEEALTIANDAQKMSNAAAMGSNIVSEGTQAAKVAATVESMAVAEEALVITNDAQKMSNAAAMGNNIVSKSSQVAKAATTAESMVAAEEALTIANDAQKMSNAAAMGNNIVSESSQVAKATATAESMAATEEALVITKDVHNVGGVLVRFVPEEIGKIAEEAPKLLKAFKIANYDPSIGNLKILKRAIKKFKNIPGALTEESALFKALKFGQKTADPEQIRMARGAMYEIAITMELMDAGETIIQVGQKFEIYSNIKKLSTREFDITLSDRLIECKNLNWLGYKGGKVVKMQKTFMLQKEIAVSERKIFEVYSKRPIPESWKLWFQEKGILFVEGTQ